MHAVHRLSCAAFAVLLLTACSGPTVVTTDDSTVASAPPAAAPAPTTRPSNAHLANAFDYAVRGGDTTRYAFITPSERWQCVIVPRVQAACGKAGGTASAIGITGAPDEIPGTDGEASAPNTILVDRSADARFAALPTQSDSGTGAPAVLPFNRILAVAGFRCNVQEATGISCLSELSGKGFTFSADGFTMTYTDVPADAP